MLAFPLLKMHSTTNRRPSIHLYFPVLDSCTTPTAAMGDAAPSALNGSRCTIQKGKDAGKDATILRSSGSSYEYEFLIQVDGEKARYIKPTQGWELGAGDSPLEPGTLLRSP